MSLCSVVFSETDINIVISDLIPLTYQTPNTPLTQNLQQCTPPPGHHEISCTEPDIIATTLQSESSSPQINVFSGGDVNQVNVSQNYLGSQIVPLFPDCDQELSPDELSIIPTFWYSQQHYFWSNKTKNKHKHFSLYHLLPSFLVNLLCA